MAVPPDVLVTVPVTVPVAVKVKLTLGVVWLLVTVDVKVCATKPGAEAVRLRLPGARPDSVEDPEASVVVLTPTPAVTVAPAMRAPPEALVTVPLTAPVGT